MLYIFVWINGFINGAIVAGLTIGLLFYNRTYNENKNGDQNKLIVQCIKTIADHLPECIERAGIELNKLSNTIQSLSNFIHSCKDRFGDDSALTLSKIIQLCNSNIREYAKTAKTTKYT